MFEVIGILVTWLIGMAVFASVLGDAVCEVFIGPKGGSNSVMGKLLTCVIYMFLTLFVVGWRLL